jgi:hypothetical protein
MTTVQTIIDNGFAKSAAARPDSLSAPAELVARVGQCLFEACQVISRENPTLLGTEATVGFAGTGWARPTNCIRVLRVIANANTIATPTIADGTEIQVVPYDDQLLCAGLPCVTEFGQAFTPTDTNTQDPTGGELVLQYARTFVAPTATTDTVDPLFPAQFNSFLEFDIAAYLATKDKRQEDQQAFLTQKSAILQQLVDWCQTQTYSIRQRFALVTPPFTNTNDGRAQPAAAPGGP